MNNSKTILIEKIIKIIEQDAPIEDVNFGTEAVLHLLYPFAGETLSRAAELFAITLKTTISQWELLKHEIEIYEALYPAKNASALTSAENEVKYE